MSVDWSNPQDVAEKHYKYLVENDIEMWKETLMSDMKQRMESGRYGSSGQYWWKAGRKLVDEGKIKYEFHREETKYLSPNTKKYFFIRVKPDGEQMGYPLPISVMKDEDGRWKVISATQ